MGIFSESEGCNKEREDFFKEFEERTGEKVKSLELTEFRAENAIYRELNLKTYRPSIWGLLVLCEKNFYYYVATQESYMSFFMKGAGRTEEKLLQITGFSALSFSLPVKNFFSFLNPEISRSIIMRYENLSGIKREATLILNHKSDEVFAELGKYIEGSNTER